MENSQTLGEVSPHNPLPKHYVVGGVYVKELVLLKAGDTVLSHKHKFNHLSLLAKGMVDVTVRGVTTRYIAPEGINILAEEEHEIKAISRDCLWYCVHAVPEDLRGEEALDSVVVSRE